MSGNNGPQNANGGTPTIPQEVENNEGIVRDGEENEDNEPQVVLDQNTGQLEEMTNRINFPLDEEELGFVHADDDQDETVNQPNIDVIPRLPLLAHTRRESNERSDANLKRMQELMTRWPQEEQKGILEQLHQMFLLEDEEDEEPEEEVIKLEMNAKEKLMKGLLGAHWNQMQVEEARRRFLEELGLLEHEEEAETSAAQKERPKRSAKKSMKEPDNQILIDLIKRAIKNNSETEELKRLKHLMNESQPMFDKLSTTPSVMPSMGTYHLEEMKMNLLTSLFEKFTFEGQLILSKVSTNWNQTFNFVFENQTFLWLCDEKNNSQRFLPIEDCCDECHDIIDSEPVIRVAEHRLMDVVNNVMSMTKNLKCLRLYRFEMDRLSIIKQLSINCKQLQHLDLTECTDFQLGVIKQLCVYYPDLKHLILTGTDLTEEMLDKIAIHLKKLVTLAIGSTLITGDSFKTLTNSLKRLDIRCCSQLKITSLIEFLKYSGLMNIQHLRIDGYKNVEIYQKIWTFFQSSLVLLEVGDVPRDSLSGQSYVAEIPFVLRELQALKLGRNVVFETRIFDNLINSCPNLRSFSMKFVRPDENLLSEETLLQIAHKWLLIERLELIGCRFLGQRFIESLQELKYLKYLNLTESSKLEDYFMKALLPKLSALNFLVLDKCLNLGKRTVESTITMANTKSPKLFWVSMIRCNLKCLPYLKAKYLPSNLRITYSSLNGRRYVTFDGQRTKIGNFAHISEFLDGI